MDLTPKQQTSEAIRQAETILVMTGQRPSVDQVAAVIGLSMILRKVGKRVSAVVTDTLPSSVQILETDGVERNLGGLRDFILKLDTGKAQVDSLRYEQDDGKLNIHISPAKGGFAPSDVTFDYGEPNFRYDLAIVLGVPTRVRIDRAYEQNLQLFEQIPVVNLDFHRSNENYGAVNLIEPNASSLCEMLVALSESLQGGLLDAEIATTLLMGIVASTDRFTAAHTTSKSLTVAAQMMAAGARQQAVVKALYRGGGEQGRSDSGQRNEARGEQPRSERSQPRNEQRAETRDGGRDRNRDRDGAREQVRQAEAPIIQPGHIEMSEPPAETPEAQPNPDAVRTDAPDSAVAAQSQARPAMADFAAAAEVLAQRQQELEQNGPDYDARADSDLA